MSKTSKRLATQRLQCGVFLIAVATAKAAQQFTTFARLSLQKVIGFAAAKAGEKSVQSAMPQTMR